MSGLGPSRGAKRKHFYICNTTELSIRAPTVDMPSRVFTCRVARIGGDSSSYQVDERVRRKSSQMIDLCTLNYQIELHDALEHARSEKRAEQDRALAVIQEEENWARERCKVRTSSTLIFSPWAETNLPTVILSGP